MRAWRVHDEAFARDAWTGEGARRHGGRWNPPGVAVVYTSEHPALAVLEVLAANLRTVDLKHFRLHQAEVPGTQVTDLPDGQDDHGRVARWLSSGSLACRVPSSVVPGTNVLLNRASDDWDRVEFFEPLRIDPRLWGRHES